VLDRLAEGAVTLTSVGLLAPHLTDENHEALLDAVQYASKRDVERLVANLYGQPDIPASVRRLPEAAESASPAPAPMAPTPAVAAVAADESPASPDLGSDSGSTPTVLAASVSASPAPVSVSVPAATSPSRRDAVAPLSVGRYLLRVTIGAETHARLDRARDLLRHVVPNGDLALVLDRALAVLVDQLERRRNGRVSRPRRTPARSVQSRGRHIPAAVKREVSARDEGRCAFVGPHGRCSETGFLEYHHVVPYARGGASDATNLQLRCRAHNAYEAVREFGDEERRAGAGV
jgi:5-methylcytosine-specific restriction endonuclease McrA